MGQRSSVHVAMAMAIPMTLKGGKEVKGHRMRRMVQLSPGRPPSRLQQNPTFTGEKKGEEGWDFRSRQSSSIFILGIERQKQCDETREQCVNVETYYKAENRTGKVTQIHQLYCQVWNKHSSFFCARVCM